MEHGFRITCNETKEINETVAYFYQREDEYFHSKVHKNGGTVEENIKDTLSCISEDEIVYQVKVGSELSAFFTKFQAGGNIVLNSFHVLPKYRNKWFLRAFWMMVNKKLGNTYYTALCDKNKPAILHLLRNGFEKVNDICHNGKKFLILSKI